MSSILSGAIYLTVVCYAVAMAMAMVRLMGGPTAQDRVLAVDFLYQVGVLIVLVLGIRYTSNMYFEAALLMALFGFVSASAMAKFLLRGEVIE